MLRKGGKKLFSRLFFLFSSSSTAAVSSLEPHTSGFYQLLPQRLLIVLKWNNPRDWPCVRMIGRLVGEVKKKWERPKKLGKKRKKNTRSCENLSARSTSRRWAKRVARTHTIHLLQYSPYATHSHDTEKTITDRKKVFIFFISVSWSRYNYYMYYTFFFFTIVVRSRRFFSPHLAGAWHVKKPLARSRQPFL